MFLLDPDVRYSTSLESVYVPSLLLYSLFFTSIVDENDSIS
jgi:hypothetical protein